MQANERNTEHSGPSKGTWVLIGFLAVAGYFVLSEHRAHFIAWLPYLLLAACPLMHLFHGHGHHGGRSSEGNGKGAPRPAIDQSHHQH